MLNNNIEDAFAAIQQNYFAMENEIEDLKEQLATWNKDKEILAEKERANYYKMHALISLTDKELKEHDTFIDTHWQKCALPLHDKTKGRTYIYTIGQSSIGKTIIIKCPICGEEKDITDFESF